MTKKMILPVFFLFALNLHAQDAPQDIQQEGARPPLQESYSDHVAEGEEIGRHSLGVGLGQTFLNNDFHDQGDNALAPDLYYNYGASEYFDFMLNFHAWTYSNQGQEIRTAGLAPGLKVKIFPFDNLTPYLLAGFGLYMPESERVVDGQTVKSDSELVFGDHLGAGLDVHLTQNFSIGALFHYHNPFKAAQDIGPDLDGSYQKIMLTAFYSL